MLTHKISSLFQTVKVGNFYAMKPLELSWVEITFMRPISLEYITFFLDGDQIYLWVDNELGERYELTLNLIGGTGLVTVHDQLFLSDFQMSLPNGGYKKASTDDLKRIRAMGLGIGTNDDQPRKLRHRIQK